MTKLIFLKETAAWFSMAALVVTFFCGASRLSAQQFSFNTSQGHEVTISGLGSTICDPSGTTISDRPGFPQNIIVPATVSNLSTNPGAYHVVEAGKTTTVIVDVPIVDGLFFTFGNSLTYRYGTLDGPSTEGFVLSSPNAPAGKFRIEIPMTFELGVTKGYLTFELSENLDIITWVNDVIVIPITVLGPTHYEADSLGTTVEPQLPYMILHAPPGDGSNAQFVKERTMCRTLQTNTTATNSQGANLAVKLGVKGSLGFINTIDYEFSVTLKGGVTSGDMVMRSTDEQTCITINNSFMTSELIDNEGGGDIFIGYGIDLAFGLYDFVNIDEANCTAFVDRGLIYSETGEPRQFIYTKATILSEIAKSKLLMADTMNSVRIRNIAENQMDVWEQVLDLNLANINNPDNTEVGSLSFSGGNTISSSRTVSIVETNTINYENYIEVSGGVDVVVNLGGSGVAGGFEYKSAKKYGGSETQSEDEAITISYTLNDDEGGNDPDLFNMKIYQDPMFGTPIFKLDEGSRTSCPYQGGYQRDQPVLKHDGVSDDHIVLDGNPILSSATFKVDLCNESDEARTYNLKLNALSNLNGAVVSAAGVPLNGNDLGQSFEIPAESCVEDLTVDVRMLSGTSPLSYPDLELFFYAPCEEGIQSSVFTSVYFGDATGVEDLESNISRLSIFPNPTSDVVNVNFNLLKSGNVKLELYDMLGRLQMQDLNEKFAAGEQQKRLDVAQMLSGIYMLVIQNGVNRVTKKILIER